MSVAGSWSQNAIQATNAWLKEGLKQRCITRGLNYVPNPVLVIIDVQPKELGIPTKAYYAAEEVKENATQKSHKVFVHVPSEIAAHEVEEIGLSSYNFGKSTHISLEMWSFEMMILLSGLLPNPMLETSVLSVR